MTEHAAPPAFDGWDTPHYTPVPDQLFDEWLPHLSEAELKVLLYIMRRTFGFKKDADSISLSQMAEGIVTRDGRRLDWGAGVTKRSVQRALPDLIAKGLIEAARQVAPDGGDATTVYRLRLRPQGQFVSPDGHRVPAPGDNLSSPAGTQSPPQETAVQETANKNGSGNEIDALRGYVRSVWRKVTPAELDQVIAAWRTSGQPAADWWHAQTRARLLAGDLTHWLIDLQEVRDAN